MRSFHRVSIAAGLLALVLFILGGPTAARPGKKPSMREEIRQLKAQVTELRLQIGQLQSSVAAERQRLQPGDGTIAPGLPGFGLCGDPCAVDSDGDGRGDCEDLCPCDGEEADGDADGTPDCLDPCPDDATDACIDPCRWDSDGDRTNDCEDPCPWDPAEPKDADNNGVIDCVDLCWLMAPDPATGVTESPVPPPPWCPIWLQPDAPLGAH